MKVKIKGNYLLKVKLDEIFAAARSENNEILALEMGSKMRAIRIYKKEDIVSWITINSGNRKSSSTLIN